MDRFSFSSSVTWLSVLQQKRRKAIVKYFGNSVMEKGLLFLPYQCISCGFIWMNCISKLGRYSSSTHMKILWQETKTPNWWPFKCVTLEADPVAPVRCLQSLLIAGFHLAHHPGWSSWRDLTECLNVILKTQVQGILSVQAHLVCHFNLSQHPESVM